MFGRSFVGVLLFNSSILMFLSRLTNCFHFYLYYPYLSYSKFLFPFVNTKVYTLLFPNVFLFWKIVVTHVLLLPYYDLYNFHFLKLGCINIGCFIENSYTYFNLRKTYIFESLKFRFYGKFLSNSSWGQSSIYFGTLTMFCFLTHFLSFYKH